MKDLRSIWLPASASMFATDTPNLLPAMAMLLGLSHPAFAQVWTQTSAPTNYWTSVASSADGSKLVATSGGAIYTSADSGVTWVATSAPMTNWISVASSADGTKLVAAGGGMFANYGSIYTSEDSGVTWTQTSAPITNWSSITSSADGSKLAAVVGGYVVYVSAGSPGPIYISTDSGATWTTTSVTNANCTSVASSADGRKLVAVAYTGPFYFSRDAGAVWEEVVPTFAYLVSIASSADGTRLVAGTFDPFHPPGTGGSCSAVISTNSGATWNYTSAGSKGRGLVACSADGATLVKAGGPNGFGVGGPILTSIDSGATWTENGSPNASWSSVASSTDGSKLVAVVHGGGIWTLQSAPAPKLRIAPFGSGLVISWIVPSINFTLQQNSDLNTTNWTDVPTTPTLNDTYLEYEVCALTRPGQRWYRLRH